MASIRLPQSAQPHVSIVVLVTDTVLAARVLRGIAQAHDPSIEAEVVVVVNTADAATRLFISNDVVGPRAIVRHVNTGTAVGWNLGFDAAKGSFVALLHEDSVPEPGWLEPLLTALSENPRAAVAASRLLHPDGTPQGGGIIAWQDGEVTWVKPENAPKAMSSDAPYPIGHGSSAAMLIERAAWAAVGGFDERYFPAFRVEVDFGLALRAQGRTALSVPRSLVRHDLMSSTPGGADPFRTMSFRRYLQDRNRRMFLAKWSTALSLLPVPPERQSRQSREAVEFALEQLSAEAMTPVRRQIGGPRATRPLTAPGEAGLDRRLEAAHAEIRDGFLAWAVSALEGTTGELERERNGHRADTAVGSVPDRGDPLTRAPVPFVVGAARSGTTLLRLMLDSHPQLAIPPETHFLSKLHSQSPRNPAEFLSVLRASPRWRDWQLDGAELERELERLQPFTVSEALRTFYGAYSRRFGKSRWGDKTPAYAERLEMIERLLPEAAFIHIVRDPRDVVLSIISAGAPWWGSQDPREAAERWSERVRTCRAQGARARRYLEVRYEDLIRSPTRILRNLCEFLELEWDPAMLSYHERAADRLAELGSFPYPEGARMAAGDERRALHAMTSKPPAASRIGRWREELPAADRAVVEEVAGELLRELDYTPEAAPLAAGFSE